MWTESQQRRLAVEKAILEKEMPQFEFHDPTGDTYVEGDVKTSSGNEFTLRCVLGRSYPDRSVSLYVASPRSLPKYGGGTVNAEEKSHKFHTGVNGPGGCVQICHFKAECWDSTITLVAVLIKGVLWCESYCMHLKTGRPISDYCPSA
jgi:hypothetical protein